MLHPNQVTAGNGELDLTMIARTETCGGVTRSLASGIVNSDSTFRFTYGYAEARIWMPAGSALWPAWWTDGQNWPSDGEIDVVEGIWHRLGRGVPLSLHRLRRGLWTWRSDKSSGLNLGLAHLRRQLAARRDHVVLRRRQGLDVHGVRQ